MPGEHLPDGRWAGREPAGLLCDLLATIVVNHPAIPEYSLVKAGSIVTRNVSFSSVAVEVALKSNAICRSSAQNGDLGTRET